MSPSQMTMASNTIDETQRKAAKAAGLAYLVSFASVVAVNFGIFARLIVRTSPADTARNILAHEQLFRFGIVGDVVYCLGVLVVSSALYVILKPWGRNLALLAALGRLVHGLTWLLVTVNFFTVLRLLDDPGYARMFGQEQLEALVRLHLSGMDQYYIGLPFWSVAAAIVGVLWLKSGYIPRALAVFGVIASVWCAACTVVYYIFPGFEHAVNIWWFDSPMAIFEIVTSFWLLFKGLGSSGIPVPDRAEAGVA